MKSYASFEEELARSQLKNTGYVGKNNSGAIVAEFQEDILNYTNKGLIDITTRKKIFTGYVDLTFQDGVRIYPLTGDPTYLSEVDGQEFSIDEFVNVIDVFDSSGKVHSVDTNGHFTTPSFDTLRFTESFVNKYGPKVRVRYQKTHPELFRSHNINLPKNLILALELFVAGLALCHLNGKDHISSGNKYYGKYLSEMGEDTLNNSSSTSEILEDNRFCERGFV